MCLWAGHLMPSCLSHRAKGQHNLCLLVQLSRPDKWGRCIRKGVQVNESEPNHTCKLPPEANPQEGVQPKKKNTELFVFWHLRRINCEYRSNEILVFWLTWSNRSLAAHQQTRKLINVLLLRISACRDLQHSAFHLDHRQCHFYTLSHIFHHSFVHVFHYLTIILKSYFVDMFDLQGTLF